MPNWCHNTLTVSGEPAAVAAFARKVAVVGPDADTIQPLTFSAHVPEPTAEEYAAMEALQKVTCTYCGGRGKRPITREEAASVGAGWFDSEYITSLPATFDDRPDCNVCHGTGKELPYGSGWYGWRVTHWGTKWDANFDGTPLAAFGTEDAVVQPGGSTESDGKIVYRFDTAWCAPLPWLEAVVNAELDLTFDLLWGEAGEERAGHVLVERGEVLIDEDMPIEEALSPDMMWF